MRTLRVSPGSSALIGRTSSLLLIRVVFRKNSKVQKRGKINLIGRLQLTTERMREEENEGIVQLRILRTQVGSCGGDPPLSLVWRVCFLTALCPVCRRPSSRS